MATPSLDGIDTSHWQEIDKSVSLPPLVFAMHKLTEGTTYRDPTASTFISHYRSNPQIQYVGFYHWLRSTSDATAQAKFFLLTLNALGGLRENEFVVLDWERTPGLSDPTVAQVETWCRVVGEAVGSKRVAVYSAPWVTNFALWRSRNPQVPLFLANYRTSKFLPGNGWSESERLDATVWQWTGSGATPGIKGHCDQNQVRKKAWFEALVSPAKPQPPVVVPPVAGFDPAHGHFGLYPLNPKKPTLRINALGEYVKYLQGVLKKYGISPMAVDGRFGNQTYTGVRLFQRKKGLVVDGVVGPQTWAAIDKVAVS